MMHFEPPDWQGSFRTYPPTMAVAVVDTKIDYVCLMFFFATPADKQSDAGLDWKTKMSERARIRV